MKSVLVYGPKGCGKTRNACLIAGALGLTKVVDAWETGEELPLDNTLILTTATPSDLPHLTARKLTLMTYDEAMQHVYRPPLCIYHANCADGFGAAWVVRKALPNAEFHAARHGDPVPDVAGRSVVIVDFSYSREDLLQMSWIAKGIVVIDHHKTAAEALAGLPCVADFAAYGNTPGPRGLYTCLDMERSGAGLTWDFFFPGQPRPALIDHIEDRDLWRFRLEGTREVQANVFSYPYDFEVWDQLAATPAAQLRADGIAIERKHHKDIAELLKAIQRRMTIGGYDVPAANLPYIHSSDAGHVMAQGEPFAACYWDTPTGRTFSLRSEPEGLDVSAIAKLYGGGGHRNAAGFSVGYDHPLAHNALPLKGVQAGGFDLLASLLNQADSALMSAECHQFLSQARKDINTARNALTKAIRELAQQTAEAGAVPIAWVDVRAERLRQSNAEGWVPEHDDEHDGGELAAAGAAYALHAADQLNPYSQGDGGDEAPIFWPWHDGVAGRGEGPEKTQPAWWKPTTARRDLVKAAALILAEIERLDRAAARQTEDCSKAPDGWKCTRTAGHDGPCAAEKAQGGE